ncbi:MAG: hypothetical protein LKE48_03280 [Solobacterium sp.]|jgi:hypothetical protein|nr:hypothetical protein [Solobacterium sp.]MCH4281527.1 hypothetical protein [Solobacterium sp.]
MMLKPSEKELKLSEEVNEWRVIIPRTDKIVFKFKEGTPQEIRDKWELGKRLYGWKAVTL